MESALFSAKDAEAIDALVQKQSVWQAMKAVIRKKYPAYLKVLNGKITTPARKAEFEQMLGRWENTQDKMAYEETVAFDQDLKKAMQWTAMYQNGVSTSVWNIQSTLNSLTTSETLDRSTLLDLAVACNFTLEETRQLMFQILESKEQNDFNPRRLDELLYLAAIQKQYRYNKPRKKGPDSEGSLQGLLHDAQIQYLRQLFGSATDDAYAPFIEFLTRYEFLSLGKFEKSQGHIRQGKRSLNPLNSEKLSETALAYVLYLQLPWPTDSVQAQQEQDTIASRFAELLYYCRSCFRQCMPIPILLEGYSTESVLPQKDWQSETMIEDGTFAEGSAVYQKLRGSAECAVPVIRILLEYLSARQENTKNAETATACAQFQAAFRDWLELQSTDLYAYFRLLGRFSLEKTAYDSLISDCSRFLEEEARNREAATRYHPGRRARITIEESQMGKVLLRILKEVLGIISQYQQDQTSKPEMNGQEIWDIYLKWSALLEYPYYHPDGIVSRLERARGDKHQDNTLLYIPVRGRKAPVQYHEYRGTETVEILFNVLDSAEMSPEKFLEEMLENLHVYELYEPNLFSLSRQNQLQNYFRNRLCQDGIFRIDADGFYEADLFRKQCSGDAPVTRNDLVKLFFWSFTEDNYPSESSALRSDRFVDDFSDLAVSMCCSEISSYHRLDRLLLLCLEHTDPIGFLKEAIAQKPAIRKLF